MVVGDADIQYAKSGDSYVAYQARGRGPEVLLAFGHGTIVCIDREEEPHLERFDRRLAAFSRLIRFDPRGVGLSDPIAGGSTVTVESWMYDAVAVLDAVGASRATVFGVGTSGLPALLFAASFPERTKALILMHSAARMLRDSDYPWGIPPSVFDRFVSAVTDPRQPVDDIDDVELMAPSLAGDAEFRAWWRRASQRTASPATARALDAMTAEADLRAVLPMVKAPTLVLHRVENDFHRMGHSRFLAEHITEAVLVELSGRDHVCFAGDTDELLEVLEESVTGAKSVPDIDRVLATVLFTDIVGSTARATDLGDGRWRDLLDDHDRMVGRQVNRFGGRQVKTTGDGVLAIFDGPARAVRCALAIRDGARQLGLEIRGGLHAGEVERRGEDVAGIAVHIAARVQAQAGVGEVWVSRTVVDLVIGSALVFRDQGEHELKGVRGPWRLFAVDAPSPELTPFST